jgi:hypothetical protein
MPRSVVQDKKKQVVQKVQVNRFKVLAMDSDSDAEDETHQDDVIEQQAIKEEDIVYMGKKKNKNRVEKIDREGWTSITWTKPQFVSEDDEERAIQKEMLEEIAEAEASMADDEAQKQEKDDSVSAMMWAERIRQSLEKAEQSKKSSSSGLSDDFVASLGKLSFFRRTLL